MATNMTFQFMEFHLIESENENGDTTNDKSDEVSTASEIDLVLGAQKIDFDKLTGHRDESGSEDPGLKLGLALDLMKHVN